ncbi:MAG: GntG family PLP-dependent aldolase [Flavobacteriaceae bacterium]
MIIDLRSDTVTKPTQGMLEAMYHAHVGDDVYKEDPTVNALEVRVAAMFGAEQALFFPTGSMANQAAIKLHTQPGEQLICHEWAHVYNYEGGGVSFNSGVSCKLIGGERGMISASDVERAINPPDFYHSPLTSLVCIENTTNKGGGACYDIETLKEIKHVCETHGLKYHLDGARLWNAIIEKKEDPKQYGALFDTISLCFSKGLGTPLGTVLIGTKDAMKNAMRVRKVLGGGMRQVGYIAAAGLYALDHHLEQLKEDHTRAKEIAETLSNLDYIAKVEPTETNIVIFYLKESVSEQAFLKGLEGKGVKISSMGQGKLRIVTHLDYTSEMHQLLLGILQNYPA